MTRPTGPRLPAAPLDPVGRSCAVVAAGGSFAAVSTLLGSPRIGAFLLMEASGLGGAMLELVLVPGVLASGIGALVKCFSKLKKSGGALRLAGVKGMVEGVLKLTRVNTVIGTYPTADAASEDFPPANQS